MKLEEKIKGHLSNKSSTNLEDYIFVLDCLREYRKKGGKEKNAVQIIEDIWDDYVENATNESKSELLYDFSNYLHGVSKYPSIWKDNGVQWENWIRESYEYKL